MERFVANSFGVPNDTENDSFPIDVQAHACFVKCSEKT